MKQTRLILMLICCFIALGNTLYAQSKSLKLIFIRHAERPDDGDNLNCKGFNRSVLLPAMLYKKFGKPDNIYVPSLGLGKVTKHTRMLQTITPMVVKYNLTLNSAYDEQDYKGIGKALLKESGTILIVWEHKNIAPILSYFGVKNDIDWPGTDFDSIWVVTFPNGKAKLTLDKEQLNPPAGCPF